MEKPIRSITSALLLASVLAGVSVVPLLNWMRDPTDVLRRPDISLSSDSNERFLKIDRLNNSPAHAGVLLGSSHTGLLNPGHMPPSSGVDWYNAGFFQATPTEMRDVVKFLDSEGKFPQRIMLGLDIFTFSPGATPDRSMHHPLITSESWSRWYLRQIFAPNARTILFDVLSFGSEPLIRFDYTSGQYQLPGYERMIASDPEGYIAKRVVTPVLPLRSLIIDQRQIDALDEIGLLADRNRASVCVFWYPHRTSRVVSVEPHDLAQLKSAVKGIFPDIVDLLQPSWGEDPTIWYDHSHLRPVGSDRVIRETTENCFPSLHSAR